jgi:predicted nicotinamide N-methyase
MRGVYRPFPFEAALLIIFSSRTHWFYCCCWTHNPIVTRYKSQQQQQQQQRICIRYIHTTAIFVSSDTKGNVIRVAEMDCVPISVEFPCIGATVTVVEVTAESQEKLVAIALEDSNREDPYGAVLWPAARAVADRLLERYDLQGTTILEIGAGTGLVSLAALLGGARKVLATDYQELPLELLQYSAHYLNPHIDDSCLSTRLFDITSHEHLPIADIMVAADVLYEPQTGIQLARRVVEALESNMKVLIGDSPGRAGRGAFLQELENLGVAADFRSVSGWTITHPRHELICGENSLSISKVPQHLDIAMLELDPSRF